jgi:hypothetical protein
VAEEVGEGNDDGGGGDRGGRRRRRRQGRGHDSGGGQGTDGSSQQGRGNEWIRCGREAEARVKQGSWARLGWADLMGLFSIFRSTALVFLFFHKQ